VLVLVLEVRMRCGYFERIGFEGRSAWSKAQSQNFEHEDEPEHEHDDEDEAQVAGDGGKPLRD
jgi:hypothetical protein